MKRHSLKFLSLFLPFIASSCCYEHDRCEQQEYQDDYYLGSCDCCYEDNMVVATPWSFSPKARCNRQIDCPNQIVYGDQSQVVVEEPPVTSHVLGGQTEEQPIVLNLTLDLKENPTKYLHFIATLDEENFLTLIAKNKGPIPLQEITVRVSSPSLPHLLKEKVVVKFDGSVAEGASLTAQTKIGPFANFDELKDSLQVNFVGAIPSVTTSHDE